MWWLPMLESSSETENRAGRRDCYETDMDVESCCVQQTDNSNHDRIMLSKQNRRPMIERLPAAAYLLKALQAQSIAKVWWASS
jgi:hypothetical protein